MRVGPSACGNQMTVGILGEQCCHCLIWAVWGECKFGRKEDGFSFGRVKFEDLWSIWVGIFRRKLEMCV